MTEAAPRAQLRLVLEYGALRPSWLWKENGQDYDRLPGVEDFVALARRAEDAHFDAVFFADFIGVNRDTLGGRATIPFEPLTLLAAVASRTTHIGLVGTASTLFNFPYNVARQLASLDHLSHGRAGWNVVTSFTGEGNYGLDTLPMPEERYARAQEFVDVSRHLWRSWDDDAIIPDAADPRYVDPSKVHDIAFAGRWHRVEGALDIPRPVQGDPVIFQAGASGPGVAFAALNADATFIASPNLEHAQEFRRQFRDEEARVGREQAPALILPGLRVVLAPTAEEADALRIAQLAEVPLEALRARVEAEFEGLDLSGIGWDDAIPADRFPSAEDIGTFRRRRSRAALYLEVAFQPGATLRTFLRAVQSSGGHLTIVGTPDTVADEVVRWYESGAIDGFLLGESIGIDLFFDEVVPILSRRGVFRAAYSGNTLRDHLGVGA